MEQTGKITWIGDIKEHNGDLNLGLRIHNHDGFLNIFKTKEELEAVRSSLQKGFEVKIDFDGSTINHLTITNAVVEKPEAGTSKGKTQKITIGEKSYDAEYADISGKKHILFGSLTRIAKLECDEIKYEILEKVVSDDFKRAWVHGRLHVKTTDGKEHYFDAMGSSTPENTGKMTSDHPLEMADTRWKGRAIRLFLGIGEAMSEEIKQ